MGRPHDRPYLGDRSMRFFTKDNAKAHGQKGGQATKTRHGRAHYQRAGAIGFQVTVERHWHGDRAAYTAYLREKGLLASCDREFMAVVASPEHRALYAGLLARARQEGDLR